MQYPIVPVLFWPTVSDNTDDARRFSTVVPDYRCVCYPLPDTKYIISLSNIATNALSSSKWWLGHFLLLKHRVYELVTSCQIAKFMGPTWGPFGSCRPQMGLMLAPWTPCYQGCLLKNHRDTFGSCTGILSAIVLSFYINNIGKHLKYLWHEVEWFIFSSTYFICKGVILNLSTIKSH